VFVLAKFIASKNAIVLFIVEESFEIAERKYGKLRGWIRKLHDFLEN
jgi:hypothetical protein